MPSASGQPVFQLRITLHDVHPPVWRRRLVPGGLRLDKLHRMIQSAFGWWDYHLHDFKTGEVRWGTHIDDCPEDELDDKSVTVVQTLQGGRRFSYEYDCGDSWGDGPADIGA